MFHGIKLKIYFHTVDLILKNNQQNEMKNTQFNKIKNNEI